MLQVLTGPVGLIVIGIMLLGVLHVLVVMASWRIGELEVHDLRVEAHRLRLHIKTESANRVLNERRRRRRTQTVDVDEPISPDELHTDSGSIYVAEAA